MAIDLDFSKNQILLNPGLPKSEFEILSQLAHKGFQDLGLKNHVALSTSGTTRLQGQSQKIVFLSQKALLTSAESVNRHLECQDHDIWGSQLPLFHVGGLGIYLRSKLKGKMVVAKPLWDPRSFSNFLIENSITLTSLVPTQVFDLVAKDIPAPSTLRAVIVGGAALHSDLYLKAISLGWPLLPSYGMTETCSQIATAETSELLSEKMPLPSLLSHARLINRNKKYYIESQSLLTAYGQIRDGSFYFWDPKEADGTLLIDDLIVQHGNQIEVLGRGRDYFKISGEGLNLLQLQMALENVLNDMKLDSRQYHLDYVDDLRTGSQVVLFSTSNQNIEEICERYKALVLPVAKIRKIQVVESIPRSPLGKVEIQKLKGKLK